jgi:hypothetical protein
MVFMVFSGDPKGIGYALISVTYSIFVEIKQSSEFRLLCHIVGIFFGIVINPVGLHEVLRKFTPGGSFSFPDFSFPCTYCKGAVRFVAESQDRNRSTGKRDGFNFVSIGDFGLQ